VVIRLIRRVGVSALLLGVTAALPVAAMQDRPPGWIGVRVGQRYECIWETQEEWKTCELVLTINEMQEAGPAATSGLELGDRLIAINGEDIDYRNWNGLVGSIRAGTPVSIDVLRGENRHFAQVLPDRRPPNAETVRMVARPVQIVTTRSPRQRVFVLALTEPQGNDGVAFALTVRDTEDDDVLIEPAALRVMDGQLRVARLQEHVFVELPELRRELLGGLAQMTEATYESATNALRVFDSARTQLSSREYRARLSSIARIGGEEAGLSVRFIRSFGGAEFEPVRRRDRSAGLLVLRVVPRTAAARVGLRSGDFIVRAGDVATREVQDLVEAVQSGSPQILWIRDGQEMTRPWPGR